MKVYMQWFYASGRENQGCWGGCAPVADIAGESLKIQRLRRLGAKPLLSVLAAVSD